MDSTSEPYQAEQLAERYLRQIRGYSPNAGCCLEKLRGYGAQFVIHAALITLDYQHDMMELGYTPDCEPYVEQLHCDHDVQALFEHTLNALATDWQIGNIRRN